MLMEDKMAIRTDRSHIFYWVNNIFFTNRANQSLIFYGVKVEIIATQVKIDILNSHKFFGVIERKYVKTYSEIWGNFKT